MKLLALTGLVIALQLAVAPSAPAQLPVGEAEGVRINRESGKIVIRFTQRAERLRRRLAGRVVDVDCTDLSPRGSGVLRSGGGSYRVPRRARMLRTGDRIPGRDLCLVTRRKRPALAVEVPLSLAGAVYLDEREKARSLQALLSIAGLLAEKEALPGYPSHSQLLRGLAAQPRNPPLEILARVLVPLGTPADTPPKDTVGYYSDGAARVAAVVVSASGRRLFIEYGPDEVLHTNLTPYLFGDEGIQP